MQEQLRVWEVSKDDQLIEISKAKLNLEERIQRWVEQDISIISPDLLVIGREVFTDYNGAIDLLCLDTCGDVIIIELKRDKTPREVTAQALDYASWVKNLTGEQVISIATNYFNALGKPETIEQAFQLKFDRSFPEIINNAHKILIVASEIDPSTERIINYLSATYQVPINVIRFNYFNDNHGCELLARQFLVDPDKLKKNIIVQSSRKANKTYEELAQIAENKGVGNIYKLIYQGLIDYQFWTKTTTTCITFTDKKRRVICNLIPDESNQELGLKFKIYLNRLSEYLNKPEETIAKFLPNIEPISQEEWSGLIVQGFFHNEESANHFLKKLNEGRSNTI
ncbi:DUF91 domain-containing protein [Anabaena minutissima FACHB-250]|nr:DUF91 domain-containing protein [Anabaena minutissima FACHB-250]